MFEAKITICVALLIGNAQYDEISRSPRWAAATRSAAWEFLWHPNFSEISAGRGTSRTDMSSRCLTKSYNVEEQQALVGTEIETIRGVFARLSPSDLLPLRISFSVRRRRPRTQPSIKRTSFVWLYRSILRKNACWRVRCKKNLPIVRTSRSFASRHVVAYGITLLTEFDSVPVLNMDRIIVRRCATVREMKERPSRLAIRC